MDIIITDRVHVTNRMKTTNCKTQLIVAIFADSSSPEGLIIPERDEYASLVSAKNALNQAIRSLRKTSLYGTEIRKEDGEENLYIIRKL